MTKKLPLLNRKCIFCGIDISQKVRCAKYCSEICGDKVRAKAIVKILSVCILCEKFYFTYRSYQKYCSIKCRLGHKAERDKDRLNLKAHDRRVKIRDLQKGPRFTRRQVFDRDGWICQLCFTPIDWNIKGRNSFAPSLDHIIPISRGGTHTIENVWTAHYGCNCRKHAKAGANFFCSPPQKVGT